MDKIAEQELEMATAILLLYLANQFQVHTVEIEIILQIVKIARWQCLKEFTYLQIM